MILKTFSTIQRLAILGIFFCAHFTMRAQVIVIEPSIPTDSVSFDVPAPGYTSNGEPCNVYASECVVVTAWRNGYRPKAQRKYKSELKKTKRLEFEGLDKFPGTEATMQKKITFEGAHWNAKEVHYHHLLVTNGHEPVVESRKQLTTEEADLSAGRKTAKILEDIGLLDTTTVKRGFADKNATLHLYLEMDSLIFYSYRFNKEYNQSLASASGTMKWIIKDAFDQEVFSQSITAEGVEFPLTKSTTSHFTPISVNGHHHDGLRYLLTESLYQFLTSPELKKGLDAFSALLQEIPNRPLLDLPAVKRTGKSINESLASTVSIKVKDGHGSGVVLSADGYIATNYHVVGRDSSVQIITHTGDTLQGQVVRIDPTFDLALVKCTGTSFNPYPVSTVHRPAIGSSVYAVGTPMDLSLGQTINGGIISAHRTFHGREFYQTDARVSGGNSGGALINQEGELIGIVSSKIMGYGVEGICFAIPVQTMYQRLRIRFQ